MAVQDSEPPILSNSIRKSGPEGVSGSYHFVQRFAVKLGHFWPFGGGPNPRSGGQKPAKTVVILNSAPRRVAKRSSDDNGCCMKATFGAICKKFSYARPAARPGDTDPSKIWSRSGVWVLSFRTRVCRIEFSLSPPLATPLLGGHKTLKPL